MLVTEMTICGVTQMTCATKKHLHRKVEAEFGKSVHIIPGDTGELLVYPDNLKIYELVKICQELKDEQKLYKLSTDQDAISQVALKIRNDIHNQDITQAWPPHVSDLEKMNKDVPKSLVKFLQTLLTGASTESNNPSQKVQRLTASFSQDLMYAVTSGRVQPTKHIVLPFAVKSVTGNVELIQILNRLGHSVSYYQVEEIDTALCLQKQAASEDAIPLPQTSSLVCSQHWHGTI